ncbi:hypothetical protein K7432_012195 [Basidiobolus ranarum]|uniref:Uncharacterized protein n=1 Tax=Basidiobolus ranarum TaxID=34480 RepID=A0ABR2VSN2_9FUNG
MNSTPKSESNRKAFEELIAKNHREYGLFMEHDYHNHGVHLLGSLYDLGASQDRMHELYQKLATKFLWKLPESKYDINEHNYKDYIGKNDAYRDLMDFFEREISKLDFDKTFQKYVPTLLPGLGGHLAHPLIHLGYAAEFNNKLILAEALAFATLAYDFHGELIDKVLPGPTSKDPEKILDEISKDTRYEDIQSGPAAEPPSTRATDAKHIEYTQEYFAAGDPNFPNDDYSGKIHELSRAITLLFLGHASNLRLRFLLCHVLTSFHGVRVILPKLTKNDQIRALRLVWLTALQMFVVEGRPKPTWENIQQYPIDDLSKDKTQAWEQISTAAINDEDIHGHAIKSVRAMKRLAETYPEDEEIWRRGCWKVTNLVKTPDDWSHSFDPEPIDK